MSVSAATADRDDLLGVVEIDAFDFDRHSQDSRCKRHREMFFKYGVESDTLFGFVVGVEDCVLDQLVQLTGAQALGTRVRTTGFTLIDSACHEDETGSLGRRRPAE